MGREGPRTLWPRLVSRDEIEIMSVTIPVAACWRGHNMLKTLFSGVLPVAAACAFAGAAPALAQEPSYTPGEYWDVSDIDVIDGQEENYLDFLAANWKRDQEWAKSKGYISDYHVLANDYPRAGEPDLFLVVIYKEQPTRAEQERRRKEYEAFVSKNSRMLVKESGDRGPMRKLMGNSQLTELKLK